LLTVKPAFDLDRLFLDQLKKRIDIIIRKLGNAVGINFPDNISIAGLLADFNLMLLSQQFRTEGFDRPRLFQRGRHRNPGRPANYIVTIDQTTNQRSINNEP